MDMQHAGRVQRTGYDGPKLSVPYRVQNRYPALLINLVTKCIVPRPSRRVKVDDLYRRIQQAIHGQPDQLGAESWIDQGLRKHERLAFTDDRTRLALANDSQQADASDEQSSPE